MAECKRRSNCVLLQNNEKSNGQAITVSTFVIALSYSTEYNEKKYVWGKREIVKRMTEYKRRSNYVMLQIKEKAMDR